MGTHHAIAPEQYARIVAEVHEPDLDWDNLAEYDLLDRTELIETATKLLDRLARAGFRIQRLDDFGLDEFDTAEHLRGGRGVSGTAEEAMLVAALEDDQETLDRLARDATTSERIELTKALNRVYSALVAAQPPNGASG